MDECKPLVLGRLDPTDVAMLGRMGSVACRNAVVGRGLNSFTFQLNSSCV